MKKVRMSYLDIRMVVEELEAWEKRERGQKITWVILERIFPFTRQTMYSKSEIKEAYKKARIALKTGKINSSSKVSENNDLVIQKLKNRIKVLELQVEEFQKFWISNRL